MPRFSPLPRNDAELDASNPVDSASASGTSADSHGQSRLARLRRAVQSERPNPDANRPRVVSGEELAIAADAPFPATSIHWVAFLFAAALLFVKAANLPELSYAVTGANLKILYFIVPIAYFGVFVSQGLDSALRSKGVIFFLLFYMWMVMATPTSFWFGGSVGRIKDFGLHVAPLVLVLSATIMSWKQVRVIFTVLAFAAIAVLISARVFGEVVSGRISLASSGTIGNSNDLAAHLLLMLSFLLYIVLDKKRNFLFRGLAIASIAYGLYVILGTGSRGALIALGIGGIFYLVKAPMKVRIGFVAAATLAMVVMPLILPEVTKERLGSLFGEEHAEAEESGESRGYLFRKSVEYTLTHPIFGVGPDQFPNYEGFQSRAAGLHGNWHATHCSWTQVSSECGIPALIFLVIAVGSSLLSLYRCYSSARNLGVTDVARACFSLLVGTVALLVAITFLAQAYHFYFAFVIGLAIATARAGERQLALVSSGRFALSR